MCQAIEEGFILYVLQNYTTYELYFKLSKAIEEDPELNKKKAARAIARFVNLHPHNLVQKTEIIIEHFRACVAHKIDLIKGEVGELETFTEAGIKRPKDEKAPLSIIIDKLNDRFGTEFEEADRLFFEQIESELVQDETLKLQAKANKLDTFKFAFEETFIDKLIERMEQNQEIFEKILEDQSFGDLVKDLMMKNVYQRLNQDEAA